MPGMLPPMMAGMMLPPRIPAASVQPTGPVTLLTSFSSVLLLFKMLTEAFALPSDTSIRFGML